MSYVERYPDPGPSPEHPGLVPEMGREERSAWWDRARAYNNWVIAKRKWQIAESMDELKSRNLKPAERIVMVLGQTYLETDHQPMPNMLDSIFGWMA